MFIYHLLQEGVANEVMLIELAENYAEELHIEGLNAYDAVMDLWRYTCNEKSDFVLPKSVSIKIPFIIYDLLLVVKSLSMFTVVVNHQSFNKLFPSE